MESSFAPNALPASTSRKPWRLVILVLALLAGPLLAEGLVRWLLFGGGPAERWGASLRDPLRYAQPDHDDVYWKLRALFAEPDSLDPVPGFDPDLGWLSQGLDPETLAHKQAQLLAGRRPVLLYGASFAGCVTPRADCFQGLLEKSENGARYCLINYGIGGYGLDQVVLLMQRTIDLYAALDPIVIIAPVVDADVERSLLSFRIWPKPRLDLVQGELTPRERLEPGVDEWLAAHPPGVSYAWRLLLHGTNVLPQRWRQDLIDPPAVRAELTELTDALVRVCHEELESRGLAHFYFLFHRRVTITDPGAVPWQEELLLEILRRRGVPFVNSRPHLLEAIAASGQPPEAFFQMSGIGLNHLNEAGNALIFPIMERGILGAFDEP